jgi:hypothetical protein
VLEGRRSRRQKTAVADGADCQRLAACDAAARPRRRGTLKSGLLARGASARRQPGGDLRQLLERFSDACDRTVRSDASGTRLIVEMPATMTTSDVEYRADALDPDALGLAVGANRGKRGLLAIGTANVFHFLLPLCRPPSQLRSFGTQAAARGCSLTPYPALRQRLSDFCNAPIPEYRWQDLFLSI